MIWRKITMINTFALCLGEKSYTENAMRSKKSGRTRSDMELAIEPFDVEKANEVCEKCKWYIVEGGA